jgi:hypothetical protein
MAFQITTPASHGGLCPNEGVVNIGAGISCVGTPVPCPCVGSFVNNGHCTVSGCGTTAGRWDQAFQITTPASHGGLCPNAGVVNIGAGSSCVGTLLPCNCVGSFVSNGHCTVSGCGTAGLLDMAFQITTPASHGGLCPNEGVVRNGNGSSCVGTLVPCPTSRNCSGSFVSDGHCTVSVCGTTAGHWDLAFQITTPASNGGSCDNEGVVNVGTGSSCVGTLVPCPARNCSGSFVSNGHCTVSGCGTPAGHLDTAFQITTPATNGGLCPNAGVVNIGAGSSCQGTVLPCPASDCVGSFVNNGHCTVLISNCGTTAGHWDLAFQITTPAANGGSCPNEGVVNFAAGSSCVGTLTPCGRVNGDPQFTGFMGQSYQVHGTSDQVYNILSTPQFQYNALFTFLESGRARKGTAAFSHPGNYFGAVGVQIKDDTGLLNTLLITSGPFDVGLTLIVNNAIRGPSSEGFSIGAYFLTLSNQFEVLMESDEFSIRVQNSDNFLNQDISIGTGLEAKIAMYKRAVKSGEESKASELKSLLPHGVLGQTWNTVTYNNRWRHIEGHLFDYTLSDGLMGKEFKYNRFEAIVSEGDGLINGGLPVYALSRL